jgi:mono/diheme cytochrome c family protein
MALAACSDTAEQTGDKRKALPGTRGEQVYVRWCAPCHSRGLEYPGTSALQAKYGGELPAVLEDRTDLDPDTIRYFVRNGVSVMPRSRKTEISDADLDELVQFLTKD